MWRYRPDPLDLETLLKEAGTPISGAGTTTRVHALEIGGEPFFLKVSEPESLKSLLPRLWKARAWCSSTELEGRNLQWLAGQGVAVIPVQTLATRYRFGLPVAGFMLSRAQPGAPLEALLQSAPSPWRSELAEAYGALCAQLHGLGVYEPLRAKDVIVDRHQLILLDREKPPGRPGWHKQAALRSLERAWYRNRRSGLVLDATRSEAFVRGYCRVCAQADALSVAGRVKG